MDRKLWRGGSLLLALTLLLCACGGDPQPPEPPAAEAETAAEERLPPLDVSVTPGRGEDELLFAFTLGEWLTAFHNEYDYINTEEEWLHWGTERGIHSPYASVYYEIMPDAGTYVLPFLSAYVPSEEDSRVQELMVEFDDHAYQDDAYTLYEELCYHIIHLLLPSLSEEEIRAVYTDLNALSYDDLRLNGQKYGSGIIPLRLYHKDGVGIYGHFALGDYVRLCIIPVTEESLQGFAQQGTEIRTLGEPTA